MRIISRGFVLAAFIVKVIATPLPPCSWNSQSHDCDNLPLTKAATLLTPRTLPSGPFTWHVHNSETSLRITLIRKIPGMIVISVLEDVMTYAAEHIALYQDSNIAGGSFEWNAGRNLVFQLVNADNHQTTWGVLGAAALGLRDYCLSSLITPGRLREGDVDGYALYFSVTDGENVVGMGTFG